VKALVVGYGSVGRRHSRLLAELGCNISVVSQHDSSAAAAYAKLEDALAAVDPKYVVICNATDRHYDTLGALADNGYTGAVLIEKPVFSHHTPIPPNRFERAYVGYNLRFHPIIRRLRDLLEGERIVSVQAYVGQYLPDWRPDSDYRVSYSASARCGGGALRDLSHEMDYLTWMAGRWRRVCALGGHLSPLEIDSDDVFAMMFETAGCPVLSLQMNYLDRRARRFLVINTHANTIGADLVRGSITVDRNETMFAVDRDDTYRAMHTALLEGDASALCTLDQGLDTLALIEAAELSVARGEWVCR
jgi:predicted dehydrogenase